MLAGYKAKNRSRRGKQHKKTHFICPSLHRKGAFSITTFWNLFFKTLKPDFMLAMIIPLFSLGFSKQERGGWPMIGQKVANPVRYVVNTQLVNHISAPLDHYLQFHLSEECEAKGYF